MVLKLHAAMRQEVDVILSTMRERLLDVHVSQALELIEHARDHVPTERALAIFCHLHRILGHEAAMLRTRVLAKLGQEGTRPGGAVAGRADAAAAEEWDSPWSWLIRMRRRLRGRRNRELRLWVERHSGRTESKVLDVHVSGALRLVELLEPEDAYAEVVQHYTETMGVPQSLARAVYFLTLSRLPDPGSAASVPSDPAQPPGRRDEQPLRIATG